MAKKKLKKFLKKAAKAALIGGALYAGSKLLKGRKGPVSTVGQPTGVGRVADMPAHLGETVHQKWGTGIPDRIKSPIRPSIPKRKVWTGKQYGPMEDMFYEPKYKKGGRVTGIAKRGFGRALMKGKK